ncbi:MAG: DUF1289 domain-containing protein [Sulfuritalea sp.]|nr:DUF1289 domain-containing protein [Sulfuritalea sp.]
MEAGLCAGCFRTLDEIAAWATASDADKQRIVAVATERRLCSDSAAFGMSGRGSPARP